MKGIDAKRSRPSIGKPVMGHAKKERVLLFGTDQRITSGPAAKRLRFKGRIHGCTRTLRSSSDSSCTAGAVHTWPIAAHSRPAACPKLAKADTQTQRR